MVLAVAVPDAVEVDLLWQDPETGNLWLRTRITPNDYATYARMPQAVDFNGKRYGLVSWNSDNGHVWYADHKKVALPVK